jgi:hypothetical protein
MDRKIVSLLLVILAIASIGYAIYRSTAEKLVTTTSTQQVTYNEPQHGLTLGMCIFAGICLLGVVMLYRDPIGGVHHDHQRTTTRTSTNYPQ